MHIRTIVTLFFFLLGYAQAQQNIKLMHYNLLNFGNPCGNVNVLDKYAWLETILEQVRPDILTVNELSPNPIFSNGILSQSFSYTNAFARASITNEANSPIINQLFYNKDKVSLVSQSVIPYNYRDINVYRLYVKGSGINSNDSLFFYCIVGHFKASSGSSDAISRNIAATAVMNWIDQNAEGEAVLVMGDFNIYGPSEAAYKTLTNNSKASLSLQDMVQTTGWGGSGGAGFYTQSTRSSSQDCGSGGGLDDRFDMMLMSDKLVDVNEALHYIPDTYTAYGNDGDSYNTSLGCVGNPSAPFEVCSALILMSDHLPVLAELEASSVVAIEKELGIPGLELRIAPVSDQLQIMLKHRGTGISELQLSVQNLMGQEIYRKELPAMSQELIISAFHLSPGLYIVRISDQKGRFVSQKFWKR